MNEQLLLNEECPAKPRRDNLFVALRPPDIIAWDLRDVGLGLQERHDLEGKLRPVSHLHLTLFHVGKFTGLPSDIVEASRRACGAVASVGRSFDLMVDQATCFGTGGKNIPLVLTSRGRNPHLDLLYRRLVLQFAKEGLSASKARKFEPHITLSYLKRSFSTEPIDPLAWTVNDFVLIHSLIGQTKYIELGRWSFGS